MLHKRLLLRDNPYPEGGTPSFDDLVFLPANLSRLVIDPYRDACNVTTHIAGKLTTASPGLITGFDDAPDEVCEDVGAGIAGHGGTYVGRRSLPGVENWLQLVDGTADMHADASGYILLDAKGDYVSFKVAAGDKLCGVVLVHDGLADRLAKSVEAELDVVLLDGTGGAGEAWSELHASCDLELMRDTIQCLRGMNREEDVEPLYFGGLRSGTDIAKAISLGSRAGIFGVAAAMAAGGTVENGSISFYSDYSREDRREGIANILKASAGEASIMARCTGKTDVHNLEPEDLRSITIATARAARVPLAGTHRFLDAAE